jgi:hypothetical protein
MLLVTPSSQTKTFVSVLSFEAVATFNSGTYTMLHSLQSDKLLPPIIAELQELHSSILPHPPTIDE